MNATATLTNPLAATAAIEPLTSDPMYNAVINRSDLTGLTGGTSTDLDGVVTAAGAHAVGTILALTISGILQHWQLTAGTDAADGATKIRPTDYNASTNAVYWNLV